MSNERFMLNSECLIGKIAIKSLRHLSLSTENLDQITCVFIAIKLVRSGAFPGLYIVNLKANHNFIGEYVFYVRRMPFLLDIKCVTM